jgi:pimeloyl-ACP methyl ester carboxylesterase
MELLAVLNLTDATLVGWSYGGGVVLRANLASPGTTAAWLGEQNQLAIDGLDPGPLELPVLVIHGDEDRAVPIEVGEDLHERAQPNAKLARVAGGSHMLPITHPDLLAQHLLEFTE